MSRTVERAVAAFLGEPEIDWEMLKPVMCFVVLWNRLEVRHGQHLTVARLETSAASTTVSPSFDISQYGPYVKFFQERYRDSSPRLPALLRDSGELKVRQLIERLIAGTLESSEDILTAVLMIPYRIRNNLFHGRKDSFQLYSQTELFTHVNEILCIFHSDLNGGHDDA